MTGVVPWTGRELSASLVGPDEKVDLALIWIEVRDLSVMPLGDSAVWGSVSRSWPWALPLDSSRPPPPGS